METRSQEANYKMLTHDTNMSNTELCQDIDAILMVLFVCRSAIFFVSIFLNDLIDSLCQNYHLKFPLFPDARQAKSAKSRN